MEKVIIIRYSEIHLKGKNRGYFERVFALNIEKSLKGFKHETRRLSGRYLVEGFDEFQTDALLADCSQLELLEVQPTGKKKMNIKDYLNGQGSHFTIGDKIIDE